MREIGKRAPGSSIKRESLRKHRRMVAAMKQRRIGFVIAKILTIICKNSRISLSSFTIHSPPCSNKGYMDIHKPNVNLKLFNTRKVIFPRYSKPRSSC